MSGKSYMTDCDDEPDVVAIMPGELRVNFEMLAAQ